MPRTTLVGARELSARNAGAWLACSPTCSRRHCSGDVTRSCSTKSVTAPNRLQQRQHNERLCATGASAHMHGCVHAMEKQTSGRKGSEAIQAAMQCTYYVDRGLDARMTHLPANHCLTDWTRQLCAHAHPSVMSNHGGPGHTHLPPTAQCRALGAGTMHRQLSGIKAAAGMAPEWGRRPASGWLKNQESSSVHWDQSCCWGKSGLLVQGAETSVASRAPARAGAWM